MTDNTTQPEVTLDDIELARKLADRARWQVSEHWTKGFAVVIAEHRLSQPPTASTSDVREVEALAERLCLAAFIGLREELTARRNPTYWQSLPEETRERHRLVAREAITALSAPPEQIAENANCSQPAPVMVEALQEARGTLDGIYHYTFEPNTVTLIRAEASAARDAIDTALSRASNEVAPADGGEGA